MKTFISMILFLGMLGLTAFMIAYHMDRASVCKVHPVKEKREEYWHCFPGFDFSKHNILEEDGIAEKINRSRKTFRKEEYE